jgi:hypothetical protein
MPTTFQDANSADEAYAKRDDIRLLLKGLAHDHTLLRDVLENLVDQLIREDGLMGAIGHLCSGSVSLLDISVVVGHCQVKRAQSLQDKKARDGKALSVVAGKMAHTPGSKSHAFLPRQSAGGERAGAGLMQLPKNCLLSVSTFLEDGWKVGRTWKTEKQRWCMFSFGKDGKTLWCGKKSFNAASGAPNSVSQKLHHKRSAIVFWDWDSDCRTALVATPKKNLAVWNAVNGSLVQTLADENYGNIQAGSEEKDEVSCCCCSFSPCGTLVLVGTNFKVMGHQDEFPQDCNLKLWDIKTGHQKFFIEFECDSMCCDFSPCGTRFIFGMDVWAPHDDFFPDSLGNTLKIYDATTCAEVDGVTFPISFRINSCRFSPNGKIVAATIPLQLPIVLLFNATTGALIQSLAGHLQSLAGLDDDNFGKRNSIQVCFSPDGQQLASLCSEDTLLVWGTANGKLLSVLQRGDAYSQGYYCQTKS